MPLSLPQPTVSLRQLQRMVYPQRPASRTNVIAWPEALGADISYAEADAADGWLFAVQSLYIDNSDCTSAVTISEPTTLWSVTIAASSQSRVTPPSVFPFLIHITSAAATGQTILIGWNVPVLSAL